MRSIDGLKIELQKNLRFGTVGLTDAFTAAIQKFIASDLLHTNIPYWNTL